MTTENLLQGVVFSYPYLWARQLDLGQTDSKDRTCCLAFRSRSPAGELYLVIAPISDSKGPSNGHAVEIPRREKDLAGLDPARAAFVHVSEYNIDPVTRSCFRSPNAKIYGRFSRAFMERVVSALIKCMTEKEARGHRTRLSLDHHMFQ